MKNMFKAVFLAAFAAMVFGCGGEDAKKDKDEPGKSPDKVSDKTEGADEKAPDEKKPEAKKQKPGEQKTLLVTQSRFAANDDGKYVIPDAAVLMMLTPNGNKWDIDKVVDKDSNVFHKALQYGKDEILTIGANEAKLKSWKKKGDEWVAETIWHPTFGGKHNRLRDFEMADLNGDGEEDLAIATHDQGVVAVAWRKDGAWKPEEIDREADTFVHEIELGDLDGDGKMEIFATPSQPNTASGHGQGGAIVRYEWTGEKFEESDVARFDKRHVKEILVADLERDGKQELYAALEAQMGEGGKIEVPVEIRRFDWDGDKFVPSKVTDLNDRFCRFLIVGDADGDGADELVAAAFSAGIWVIEKEGDKYTSTCIDKESGGFEHAIYLADMNGDNKNELYVANDKAGELDCYTYEGGKYRSKTINKRMVPGQAMVWNITVAKPSAQ